MTENELIEKTNRIIAELVYPKYELQKAYNYYRGVMDAEQYRYLEENYGIGNPTSVEFIPLIKKHVDALVGEYLGTPILPKVLCKDSKTLTNIGREKQLYIGNNVATFLKGKLKNLLLSFIDGKNMTDVNIEKLLQDLIVDLGKNFISLYEVTALNVIEYIMQSKETDMHTKLRTLLLDLLITGYTYFRVKPSANNNNVDIEVLNPLNTFTDNHLETPYVKNASRAVVRKWLTKELTLNKYGKDLSKEDIEKLKNSWEESYSNTAYYVTSNAGTDGIRAGEEIIPGYPYDNTNRFNDRLIPVYEVEWIEIDSSFTMDRYETVRIGDEMFILKGKNEKVTRSIDNPTACSLSINGVCFTNRGSEPYSLVLACASLLDKYNLLHFYRDNLIANSGTTGDWVDLSLIPASLGVKLPERLQKWLAYKKAGIAPIDTSLEGRLATGQAPINTIFNGYDDTVKVQAVQAVLLAIDSIEQTASSITGVFRERLNGIELRDAVTNVKQSANNSFIITKLYYHLMDLVVVEILTDSLNVGKVVYKKGLKGILILGDYLLKIFTALPEYFTVSDYDIRVSTSTDIIKDMEQIKMLVPEFLKSGLLEPEVIFEALTARSLTELKAKVYASLKKLKEENNQLALLQQQAEQLQQQLKEAQLQLKQAQTKIQSLNEAQIQLENLKMQKEIELEWYKALTDRTFKNESIEIDKKKAEIEFMQLRDGNPLNDTINFNN